MGFHSCRDKKYFGIEEAGYDAFGGKGHKKGGTEMPTENEFSRFCKDFDLRRPTEPPVKKTFWFEAKFEHDSDSINDLLQIGRAHV